MKKYFAVFGIAMLLRTTAGACSCLPPPPPLESMDAAHAVFVGVPLAVQSIGERQRIFEFEVVESFKGDLKKRVKVVTGRGDGDCGIAFVIDHRYLVYANRSGRHLSAHLCTRTQMIYGSSHDTEVAILRAHRK